MLPLEDIVYAINTFPKAFIVGLVLEPTPMTVVEMDRKIKDNFPYLAWFSFLDKINLRQYCIRSLVNILDITSVHSGWEHGGRVKPYSPAYSLKDSSIQQYAKFILTQSVILNVQPQDYLALSKNSKKKSDVALIRMMLHMYEYDDRASAENLSEITGLSYPSNFNHLEKLKKAGLAKLIRFRSKQHDFSFQWVEGMNIGDVDFKSMEKDNIFSTKKIARMLAMAEKAYSYPELHALTGYSYCKNKFAINQLQKQGFVRKISSQKHAYGILTRKGREVVEQIIKPLVRTGNLITEEPTQEHLITAMKMYEKSLS
jgi:DNA-binding MarR family transcriptional regulator